jgi:hypothetical protein
MLGAGLILLFLVVDEVGSCTIDAKDPLREEIVPVLDFALACPVIADPPTEREVPTFRDLFSWANHCLLETLVCSAGLRKAAP